MTVNVLYNDIIKYANLHSFGSQFVLKLINSVQRPLPFYILLLKDGALKTCSAENPGIFSAVVNLDEAGEVSMMSIGSAHQ